VRAHRSAVECGESAACHCSYVARSTRASAPTIASQWSFYRVRTPEETPLPMEGDVRSAGAGASHCLGSGRGHPGERRCTLHHHTGRWRRGTLQTGDAADGSSEWAAGMDHRVTEWWHRAPLRPEVMQGRRAELPHGDLVPWPIGLGNARGTASATADRSAAPRAWRRRAGPRRQASRVRAVSVATVRRRSGRRSYSNRADRRGSLLAASSDPCNSRRGHEEKRSSEDGRRSVHRRRRRRPQLP
jgi:hypothetical protein